MRRIMADIVSETSQFVATPNADQKLLKIPEPGSSNSGKCGLVGVGEIVRSFQSMDVEIEASGNFLSYYREKGSRFKIKLDYLKDSAEDEITDVNNWMGEERGVIPQYAQQLEQISPTNTVPYYDIKIIELKQWNKFSATQSVIGLMGVLYKTVANDIGIQFFRMSEYFDKSGTDYIWEHVVNLDFALTSAQEPNFDMVEMDDGSLILVISHDDGATSDATCYRSFDTGTTWILNSTLDQTGIGWGSATWYMGINRIGSRIVFFKSRADVAGVDLMAQYSDDYGMSWSDDVDVLSNDGPAATHANLDTVVGKDGVLYVAITKSGGFGVEYTSDGINFLGYSAATYANAKSSCAILEKHEGGWEGYGCENGLGHDEIHNYTKEGTSIPAFTTDAGYFALGMTDAGGMDIQAFCVGQFNNNAFRDVAILTHDSEGVDYYTVTVLRTAMWSGLQMDTSGNDYFDICWFPYCYPSNDGDPDTNYWTRTLNGSGAVAFGSDGEFGHLRLSADTGDEAFYNRTLSNNSWDNGVVIRFEVKNSSTVNGFVKVTVDLGSLASTKHVKFSLIIRGGSTNQDIMLFDELAVAVVGTYVPTETGFTNMMDDWNEYVIIAKENEVRIYRAPSGTYREIQPYELVGYSAGLQEDAAYTGTEEIAWGVIQGAAQNPLGTSLTDWRSMMYKITNDMQDWDFDDDVNGKKCHTNPCGIMQGFGCKFTGEWALLNDTWDLIVGAQYQGENIFVDSPRRMYKEPVQSAGNPDRVFTWERKDVDDQDMYYMFNSIAIFNTNCFQFKLEAKQLVGAPYSTIFDSETTQRANIVHSGTLGIGAIFNNIISIIYSTSNWDTPMVPGQYASNEFRNWYIYMVSGSKLGQVYRIMNNSDVKLFFDRNLDDDGVGPGDTFYLYSDRFFYKFDTDHMYAFVQLTIQNAGITYLPDNQARLGTVILGRTYDLDDDDWTAQMSIAPNTNIITARSGLRQVRELGQEQRMLNLKYKNLTDRGMGIEDVKELYRLCRWGVRPLVWIDHDEILDGTIANMSHTEPILVRATNKLTQNRVSYNYLEQNGDWHIRNFIEEGVNLEEVL